MGRRRRVEPEAHALPLNRRSRGLIDGSVLYCERSPLAFVCRITVAK